MNNWKNSLSCWCLCFRRFAQSIGLFLVVVLLLFSKSSSLYIYIYIGFERRWELAVTSTCLALKLWFFTIDLLPDLIIVLWRTNSKSIPFETEQGLQQYYCYSCLDVETKLQRWWLQRRAHSSWLYTSYTVLCQLWWSSFWWDASDDHCFWWRVFRSSIFRLVSSDAAHQTHFFRCILPDALSSSNTIPLLFDLFNQNLYE